MLNAENAGNAEENIHKFNFYFEKYYHKYFNTHLDADG